MTAQTSFSLQCTHWWQERNRLKGKVRVVVDDEVIFSDTIRLDGAKDRADFAAQALRHLSDRLNGASPDLADLEQRLLSLQGQASESPPQRAAPAQPADDERVRLPAYNLDLPDITPQAWAALQAANHRDPRLFLHAGLPVRLEPSDEGGLVLRALTGHRLRHELAKAAVFFTLETTDDGETVERTVLPPDHIITDMLATAQLPLPALARLTELPVFAPDGSLITSSGYFAASKTYLALPAGLTVPDVPLRPDAADVRRAVGLVMEELIGEFPFVGEADRAHALALFLLPFARDLIAGPTPGHMIESPTPGSGKGLLADVLLRAAVGRQVGVVTQARDDDEWRKRITAQLREGHAAILMDNLTRSLDSGAVASALTALWWTDRLLGKNETVRVPVRCLWLATANNPVMTTEIARRFVRIRLDPRMDRPWLRQGFRHEDLRGWVDQHRAELVWAALVLIRAWLATGRPRCAGRPLGTYEQWSYVIGGMLECAGVPGFLGNLAEFYEAADTEGAVLRAFVAAWWERFGNDEVGAKDLLPVAESIEGFDLGSGKTDRSQQTALGKRLARMRDRVIGDYQVVRAAIRHHTAAWRLVPVQRDELGPSGGPGDLGDVICLRPVPMRTSNQPPRQRIPPSTTPPRASHVPHVPQVPPMTAWIGIRPVTLVGRRSPRERTTRSPCRWPTPHMHPAPANMVKLVTVYLGSIRALVRTHRSRSPSPTLTSSARSCRRSCSSRGSGSTRR